MVTHKLFGRVDGSYCEYKNYSPACIIIVSQMKPDGKEAKKASGKMVKEKAFITPTA